MVMDDHLVVVPCVTRIRQPGLDTEDAFGLEMVTQVRTLCPVEKVSGVEIVVGEFAVFVLVTPTDHRTAVGVHELVWLGPGARELDGDDVAVRGFGHIHKGDHYIGELGFAVFRADVVVLATLAAAFERGHNALLSISG